jgi:hypothetical protein
MEDPYLHNSQTHTCNNNTWPPLVTMDAPGMAPHGPHRSLRLNPMYTTPRTHGVSFPPPPNTHTTHTVMHCSPSHLPMGHSVHVAAPASL